MALVVVWWYLWSYGWWYWWWYIGGVGIRIGDGIGFAGSIDGNIGCGIGILWYIGGIDVGIRIGGIVLVLVVC